MIYRVRGHSMEPTLHEGDYVVTLPLRAREGDVVVAEKGGLRLVKRLTDGGVRGDAPCSRELVPDRILGKVVMVVKRA